MAAAAEVPGVVVVAVVAGLVLQGEAGVAAGRDGVEDGLQGRRRVVGVVVVVGEEEDADVRRPHRRRRN